MRKGVRVAKELKGKYEAGCGVMLKINAIFTLVSESPKPLSLAEVCDSLNYHKSTGHRLLVTLFRLRFLGRTNDGLYRIGPRFVELAETRKNNFR